MLTRFRTAMVGAFVLLACAVAVMAGLVWRAQTIPPPPRIVIGPLFDLGRPLYAKTGGAICASVQELFFHERGVRSADCLIADNDIEVYPDPLPSGAQWVFRVRFLMPSGEVATGWAGYAALGN